MSPVSPSSTATVVREEILAPLRRVLSWLLSLRDRDGRIICPEHRVEHTGKNAGAIVIALELARLDPGADVEELHAVAVQQGHRLAGNLVPEKNSLCQTFRPGRHDPFNCSNSVIDGGACSDALAQLFLELEEALTLEDRAAFREACLVHAHTYLRYAVVDKGIPAQRAWGLTGLAAAWKIDGEDILEEAALEAVAQLAGVQHADGSYPYHPQAWGAEHPGASDVSAYYQSRITAFLLYSLEALGRDATEAPHSDVLRRGLDFLAALQGPGGVKCGLIEAKPWYWGADHEVVSNPFDVYTLTRGWQLFGDLRHAAAATAAFRAWAERLDDSGAPRSHLPGAGWGRSYQCPVFWAGHAMWLARSAPELEVAIAACEESGPPQTGGGDISVTHYPDASLVRLEDAVVVAWVRGARPGKNVAHGSPRGAGLLRVVRKRDGAELLPRTGEGVRLVGEWSGASGRWAPRRGWRAGAAEVRFSLWHSRVHLRAGRYLAALGAPASTFRRGVLAYAHPEVSSAFALDPQLVPLPDGVQLVSRLALRDGTPVPGSGLERRFRVDGNGLMVTERLTSEGDARDLEFQIPPLAADVAESKREISYRLS